LVFDKHIIRNLASYYSDIKVLCSPLLKSYYQKYIIFSSRGLNLEMAMGFAIKITGFVFDK